MAEEKQAKKEKPKEKPREKQVVKAQLPEKHERRQDEDEETLVRVFGYDIAGSKHVYPGLTRIKGVSWAISNAVCARLGLDKRKRISELSKDELQKIDDFLTKLEIPDYMKNRRNERESGQTSHLYGTDLDITKDFDIKRLKKMRCWKGIRHSQKQPVRGQKTRSHFREKKIAIVGRTIRK